MDNISYIGLAADIIAVISLLLSMYFYYGSRSKEIDDLKSLVQNQSEEDVKELKRELVDIKKSIEHLNNETFELLKNQVSFMQKQVGQVGAKSSTKPDVEILNIVISHKVLTIETLCMELNGVDRFIVVKYVEQFRDRGTLSFDGTVIKMINIKDKNEGES